MLWPHAVFQLPVTTKNGNFLNTDKALQDATKSPSQILRTARIIFPSHQILGNSSVVTKKDGISILTSQSPSATSVPS